MKIATLQCMGASYIEVDGSHVVDKSTVWKFCIVFLLRNSVAKSDVNKHHVKTR